MTIEMPPEIIYLICKSITDKQTFYNFGLCFPDFSRCLKTIKELEFDRLDKEKWKLNKPNWSRSGPPDYRHISQHGFIESTIPAIPAIQTVSNTNQARNQKLKLFI